MTLSRLRAHRELILVLGLTIAAEIELALAPITGSERRALMPLGLVLAGSLFWRTRVPLAVLALNLLGWILIDVVVVDRATGESGDPVVLGAVLGVSIYSVGAHTRHGVPMLGGLALVAAMVVLGTFSETESDFGDVVFFSVVFGGVWLAGRAIRRRRARERELLVDVEQSARAAVLEERTRIARELHDIVAHAISVIVLQARGARHELDADPAAVRGAIDSIERTASQALGEMRRLLSMLRADDESVPMAPQPTLAQVGALAAQVSDAGLAVEVRVEGAHRELPPGVDLSAYRVVQEALTNALKHAGPARATVVLRYLPDALEIEVADTGAGTPNGDGSGHGLAGMRERVAVFGGEIESGPRPGGGFEVRARLPL